MENVANKLKTISRSEVLAHNTPEDCWLIIRNGIYDFTPFVRQHPGGSDILLTRAGEDATSYFLGKHGRNSRVQQHLEGLKIGELPQHERIVADDAEEPFLTELLDRVYAEKLYHVAPSKGIWFLGIRTINFLLFFILSAAAIYGSLPWFIAVLLVAVQGLLGTSLFGLVAHESIHRNFPKGRMGKFLLRIAWPVIWPFISQDALRYEHNSHHVKIGDPEFDFEVSGFSRFIRYSGHIAPNRWHRYQHKLAKFIYPFYANIITTIGGSKSTFWSSHNRKVFRRHALSLLATGFYYIVLPYLILGQLWIPLLLYLVYQCVLFYGIYVGAAINHFVPQILEDIPEEQKGRFGYYICHNTTNFCSGSRFWYWYTGGFNVQIEHHLIPFIPVENLHRMIPIVRELCLKYGYPYRDFTTVYQLWDAHYDYLRMMAVNSNSAASMQEIRNRESYEAR